MLFNSFDFLLFFPFVVLIYFLIPGKIKYIWLLITSYYFYMCWNPKYICLIGLSTIITWFSGIMLGFIEDHFQISNKLFLKKSVVALSFISNLAILIFFKYFDFLLLNLNRILSIFQIDTIPNRFQVLLPVGISFYTFQALGYTVDVYRKDIKPEKNILKYALFVSFFPQLVAGPIERSKNLLGDIADIPKKKMWDYDRITSGLVAMLYGYFLKMVIADRVAILVNTVFDNYLEYWGAPLLIAAIGFSLQIYCDFASYSTIAIGAARVMGFTLMENFDTPYFARSIKEFWRRWHISLSTWFRDYLYIPLGGSRCSLLKKYRNLFLTFFVSGIWHGAGWNYIIWGSFHGVLQIIEDVSAPFRKNLNKKLNMRPESMGHKILQTFVTFFWVTVAWVFFRAGSFHQALVILKRGFFGFHISTLLDGTLLKLGLSSTEWKVLIAATVILIFVSLIKYNLDLTVDMFLKNQALWFRWCILFFLIFMIIIFGNYGPTYSSEAFIYFQF